MHHRELYRSLGFGLMCLLLSTLTHYAHPASLPDKSLPTDQPQEDEGTQNLQEQKKEKKALVQIFVEMQKRTERKYHIEHTIEEEKSVNEIFEDDIKLTMDQAEEILQDLSRRPKRKLAAKITKRWKLPINYTFDGDHSLAEVHKIEMALAYWTELTCIKFQRVHPLDDVFKLEFVKGTGCWSYVGFVGDRNKKNQTISIGDGCQSNGTIAHEVGHAIGFWHEQSRPDRDDYVIIHNGNVTSGKQYNFQKRNWQEIMSMGVPYDLGSDMHYGATFYAKDKNSTDITVETRDPYMMRVIGQRQELSFYDVKLACLAYCQDTCKERNIGPIACERDGYQDPQQCHQCRCPDGFSGTYCENVAPGKRAYCGGVFDATYNGTISSPGYPLRGYLPDQACTWLLKAPPNTQIYLEFIGIFFIAGHLDVCKDYVEVRYNTSLALTGARFCLDDPPRHALVSDTNEMLVLFRSFMESRTCDDNLFHWKCKLGNTGFRAKYYIKPCGGCDSSHASEQRVCKKRKPYRCVQSWRPTPEAYCNNNNRWWLPCPTVTNTVQVRYETCYRDEWTCCSHFTREGDKCSAISSAQKRSYDVEPMYQYMQTQPEYQPDYMVNETPDIRAWSEWGPWTCSHVCGGGWRERTRRCILPSYCGHIDQQKEDHADDCAATPCYVDCTQMQRGFCGLFEICMKPVYTTCPVCNSPSFQLTGPVGNQKCKPKPEPRSFWYG